MKTRVRAWGGWGDPILVDLALSKVARGKIMMAANKGEPIPEGWSTDKHGNPTTDAKEAIDGGMMIPMGDAKGAALVLMVEILAATLTGSNHGFEASSFFSADGVPPKVGQFFILIDPSAFAHEDEETAENRFIERIGTLITAITDQDGAWLPGVDRSHQRESAEQVGWHRSGRGPIHGGTRERLSGELGRGARGEREGERGRDGAREGREVRRSPAHAVGLRAGRADLG